MKKQKNEPEAEASNAADKVNITVDSLPDHLQDMLDSALIKYANQAELQELEPNFVPYGIGLGVLSKEFMRHLNRLQKIQKDYFKGASFTLVDDGKKAEACFSDNSTTSQCSKFLDKDPQVLMAEYIDGANRVYGSIEKELKGIPKRAPGRKEDRALNLLCSDITAIYAQAGGVPHVPSNERYDFYAVEIKAIDPKQQKPLSPFVGFALDVLKIAGIEVSSEWALAERLRPIAAQYT